MLGKSEEMDCLWTDEQMQSVRDNIDSDIGKAKEAFGKVFQKYHEALMILCVNVCGDNGYADLVFEITWKKIWNNPNYDYNTHKVSFKAWMSKIAQRAWLDIKLKAILGSDAKMPEPSVGPKEFELVDEVEIPNINEKLLEEALHQLTDKEYDILMTYIEYDTDEKKHIPDDVMKILTTKYQTTPANLRQIKCRSLKKVKDYIEQRR